MTRSPAMRPDSHDALAVHALAQLTLAIIRLVVVVDDEDEAFALVVADGAFRHQQRIAVARRWPAHRNKHARDQRAVRVRKAGAGADRAGGGVDPVVEALDGAADRHARRRRGIDELDGNLSVPAPASGRNCAHGMR